MIETSQTNPIRFELPDKSLSMGDLIGRAARFVRLNYRLVYQLLLVPITLNALSTELILWLAKHVWAPAGGLTPLDPRIFGFFFLFLINWFCIWWLRVKVLTLWLLMTDRELTLSAATQRARDFRMLWIYLPTVFIELLEAVWTTLLVIFAAQFDTSALPRSAAWQILGYSTAIVILWVLPFRMLAILNFFPAYNALVSEGSVRKGFSKFSFYCRHAPLTLFFATFATALVIDSFEVPMLLPSIIAAILTSTRVLSHELVEWLVFIPQMTMQILIGVVSSGICAVFTVLFDNQLKIKLEGRDVTSNLDQIVAKA